MDITVVLTVLGGLILGLIAGYVLRGNQAKQKLREAEQTAERILKAAERDADARRREAELEVKDQLLRSRAELEQEAKAQRAELAALEKRLLQKEAHLDKREELLEQREAEHVQREKRMAAQEERLRQQLALCEQKIQEHRMKLESLAGMTSEEAKRQLMAAMEEEARRDMAGLLKRMEDETREMAQRKAQQIISLAMERMAAERASEMSVSVVNLPSDDMKGRIIGREGRNIRAFESITGVDLIIDDTPEAVILSCFDPVRREVARIALERLVSDGRIHPARIEEVVEKVRREVEDTVREEGEKAAFELGIHNLHPEIIKLLGRLKYRTSYGQNVLEHSKEVGFLCGIMAAELRGDVKLARRVGLLHDLGKAVSHEVEGGHDQIGAELAKKYGESPRVVNCIGAHHEGEEARCLEAVLVSAADAISASRPGVRRETLESYIKRLEKLEAVANSFRGVDKSFAIQAGREIRIIVKPEEVSDLFSAQISREIAKKIERELSYPGQIKVTVIRESRFVEFAK